MRRAVDVNVLEVGSVAPGARCLLLVEDNPGDARLTAKALATAGWSGRLVVIGDGREALDFLHRRPPHADAPRPALVLLDLNLPGVSGRDVLDEVRATPALTQLPVLVLSTSEDRRDVEDAYARRANAYVAKPLDYGRFAAAVRQLVGFWLDAAALP
jgi:two-component system response regulator